MQRIVPHLRFDGQALAAARFYCRLFPDAALHAAEAPAAAHGTDSTPVSFRIADCEVIAIDGGSGSSLNPSGSFMVNIDPAAVDDPDALFDRLWGGLSEDGTVLMPDASYPFSSRYGWVQDRFGLSWQLITTDPAGEPRPSVIPALLFSGPRHGGAAAAVSAWADAFPDSRIGTLARYPDDDADNGGMLMFGEIQLRGQWIVAYDSGVAQPFSFSPAFSLLVRCDDQSEIDRLWQALSAASYTERGGWLVDAHGVSWQIVPAGLHSAFEAAS